MDVQAVNYTNTIHFVTHFNFRTITLIQAHLVRKSLYMCTQTESDKSVSSIVVLSNTVLNLALTSTRSPLETFFTPTGSNYLRVLACFSSPLLLVKLYSFLWLPDTTTGATALFEVHLTLKPPVSKAVLQWHLRYGHADMKHLTSSGWCGWHLLSHIGPILCCLALLCALWTY